MMLAMLLISRIMSESEPRVLEGRVDSSPQGYSEKGIQMPDVEEPTHLPPSHEGTSTRPKRRRVSIKRTILTLKKRTSTDSDDSEEYSEDDEHNRAASTPRSRKRKVSSLLTLEKCRLSPSIVPSTKDEKSHDLCIERQRSPAVLKEENKEGKDPRKTLIQSSGTWEREKTEMSFDAKKQPLLKLKNIAGASRPPMWFATMFPYLLCVTSPKTLWDPAFYIGLLYVSAPFNLYLCGLNDVRDWDVDHLSKKRASAWRQNLTQPQLDKLRRVILLLQLPFLLWMLASFPTTEVVLFWIDASVQISLYNGFFGLPTTSRIPFVDLPMNVWAWHLPVHFYAVINGAWLPLRFCIFWALQLCAGQILAAVHDIHNDGKCGKFTTATYLGKKRSIVTASVVWMLQSLWSLSMLEVPPMVGAVHFTFGILMASGCGHIKYAYPFGFMLDSYVLWNTMPQSLPVARILIGTFLVVNIVSGLPSPSVWLAKRIHPTVMKRDKVLNRSRSPAIKVSRRPRSSPPTNNDTEGILVP